jgi:hypothetical protein
MSNIERDEFGVVKKFPDLEGGVTLVQDGPGWGKDIHNMVTIVFQA